MRPLRFFKPVFLTVFILLACVGVATAETLPSFSCEPRAHTPLLTYDFEPVLQGFSEPTSVTHAGDGSDRLFITEKSGLVRVVSEGKLLSEPFLDLRAAVLTEREQGLLSLAFHPDFEHNGRFFVFYSKASKDGALPLSVLEAYTVSMNNPDRANPEGKVVLSLPQPHLPIHKGGQLQFGPDGYLYASFGDGHLPMEAQTPDNFYGTLLRIDVDSHDPYAIPADNPFVGSSRARSEIWAYGFRNPWRFSIDPCTGALFVGDVGYEVYEEVDRVEPGKNYGWPLMEGERCGRRKLREAQACDELQLEVPIHTYRHLKLDDKGGNSVVGGYVYRGYRFPQLRGRYIFSDYVSANLWSLTQSSDITEKWQLDTLGKGEAFISSLGIDERGEILALGFASGTLYRLQRKKIDFAEENLEQNATPKTIALKNLSAPLNGLRQGRAGRSELEFYLDNPQSVAFYFEALSPLGGQALTLSLNGDVLRTYRFDRGPQFDWLALQGKQGRNLLTLDYGSANTTSLRFTVLELEALGEEP